nr:MAG TPA: hypothetical protein [Caudoviricetes sp.]
MSPPRRSSPICRCLPCWRRKGKLRARSFLSWSALIALCLLSVTGCTTSSLVCKPNSIPPLPKIVVDEAKHSSDFRTELSILRQDVLRSLEESSRPSNPASVPTKE